MIYNFYLEFKHQMESESKEIGFEDMEFEVLPELTPEEAQKME